MAVETLVRLHDLAGMFGDQMFGQNSVQLRHQYIAHGGCEALGLADIDAARAEIANPSLRCIIYDPDPQVGSCQGDARPLCVGCRYRKGES